jgi:threonine synthase
MLREGRISADERIVVLVTGNGLKDVASAIKATGKPHLLEPTLHDLRRLMTSGDLS